MTQEPNNNDGDFLDQNDDEAAGSTYAGAPLYIAKNVLSRRRPFMMVLFFFDPHLVVANVTSDMQTAT